MAQSSNARELVGRPLVPYFDDQENINATLALANDQEHERIDVDARVWNKELGYFEYPSQDLMQPHPQSSSQERSTGQKSAPGSRSSSARRGTRRTDHERNETAVRSAAHATAPSFSMDMKRTQSFTNGSSSPSSVEDASGGNGSKRVLLTPSMLSTSCPDSVTTFFAAAAAAEAAHGAPVAIAPQEVPQKQPVQPQVQHALLGEPTSRSSSSKRSSSKQRSRPNTPNRAKPQAKEQANLATPTSKANGNSTAAAPGSGRKKKSKGKEDLSASGKWAWSAFQSSPDPKELPLPPFLSCPTQSEPSVASFPDQVVSGSSPPLVVDAQVAKPSIPGSASAAFSSTEEGTIAQPPSSLEASMTADLRKLLNIGGG